MQLGKVRVAQQLVNPGENHDGRASSKRPPGQRRCNRLVDGIAALSGYFVGARGGSCQAPRVRAARSGTVAAKAMRCNARMAFVLWASLPEELAASCGLDPPASLQADAMGTILANVPPDTGAVKKAVKKVGTSRKRGERRFGR